MPANDVVELRVRIDGKPEQTFKGREAWALYALKSAGANGCTPIDAPAPRWSHYVYKIRGAGVETVHEGHGGPYSGHHARYVLHSKVQIVKAVTAGEARHAA